MKYFLEILRAKNMNYYYIKIYAISGSTQETSGKARQLINI